MNERRQGGGFSGPLPLTYTEVANWVAVAGIQIAPSEVDLLMAMDKGLLRALRAEADAQSARKTESKPSAKKAPAKSARKAPRRK